jgi:D-methionine transport system substrate-binding protein
MKKKFILFSGLLVALIALFFMRQSGDGDKQADHASNQHAINTTLPEFRVGVTAGPHAIIMDFVKKEAAQHGLNIKVVEFNDFILPNAALDHGDIMLNSYQHKLFLDDQIRSRGYHLTAIASSVLMPIGVYAFQLKTLDELKNGATVLIPSDVTNGGRALLLLQKLGLIKLKDNPLPTLMDITENPKKLVFKELDAPTLPRAMVDADIAVINTDWLFVSGLDPAKALAREEKDSPYANVIVARSGTENDADVKKFVTIYHSEPVRKFIEAEFKGAVIPAF